MRVLRSALVGMITVAALGLGAPAALAAPTAPARVAADKPPYETWIRDVTAVTTQLSAYLDSRLPGGGKKAVVFDIDNTTLETAYNFGIPTPAIPPVLAAAKRARQQGASIFFVTNRPYLLGLPTEDNLKRVGYAVDGLYLRPWFNFDPTEKVKTDARIAIEKQGYTIVANVGNNTWDLTGGHAERTFKLPDYNGALD
ncbi:MULTISPECIES: HAD family acid phosphatase [unclassified Crossiella]|uniref:HAD family acid phosphatase n=1 Tax=unclassified Crossiella TaxID=2620835 RepID=UPI0020002D29|nr:MULTISPECIES: HAD family acid phosphatase [unclassified Crossiella]MCK2238046.1 acid phosphatase [Crossiella sp. S99.2]MCK2255329.1 acid phosphatase [Crossiella sp. S99.1]